MSQPSTANPLIVRVAPGEPDQSLLIQALEGRAQGVRRMPVGFSLSDPEISVVRAWVAAGAPD